MSRTRALQHVLTHAERIRIVTLVNNEAQEVDAKHIPSRAMRQFPMLFRGNEKAKNAKACGLWKYREDIANYSRGRDNRGHPISITR